MPIDNTTSLCVLPQLRIITSPFSGEQTTVQQLYSHAAAIIHEPGSTVVHVYARVLRLLPPLPLLLLLLLLLLYEASVKKKGSQDESHAGLFYSGAEKAYLVPLVCAFILFIFFGIPGGDLEAHLLRAIDGKTETFS